MPTNRLPLQVKPIKQSPETINSNASAAQQHLILKPKHSKRIRLNLRPRVEPELARHELSNQPKSISIRFRLGRSFSRKSKQEKEKEM